MCFLEEVTKDTYTRGSFTRLLRDDYILIYDYFIYLKHSQRDGNTV